jgi:hypothetical protein
MEVEIRQSNVRHQKMNLTDPTKPMRVQVLAIESLFLLAHQRASSLAKKAPKKVWHDYVQPSCKKKVAEDVMTKKADY